MTSGCCLMTMVIAFQDTVDRPILGSNVYWYKDTCHDVVALVILVLTVDVRVGLLKNDESRHILAKTRWVASYFSSSSQLESWDSLILRWHCSWSINLFFHFLWVSAFMALISFFVPSLKWWFSMFMSDHEQAQCIFTLSCKTLMYTYPKEIQRIWNRAIVHNFCNFPLYY
jgi:hypothetical protein